MAKQWVIYKHTNKTTGKAYIGLTSQTTTQRWGNGRGYTYKSGQHKFAQAIRKYGWDNFTHEIIEQNINSLKKASEREKYWIKYYDTFVHGYNMSPGGAGQNKVRWRAVLQLDINTLEIVKEYESASMAAAAVGEISGANIIACCRHKQKTARGFAWCYKEDYEKVQQPQYVSRKKPVYQIDRNTLEIIKQWPGIVDAAQALQIGHSHIISCCKKRRATAGGYRWCYVDQYENWEPPARYWRNNKYVH